MSEGREVIGTSMRLKGISVALGLALVGLLLFGAASASADISFCPVGKAAGQCENTGGVAVDRSNGRVYVADSGNDRINVFDEDGAFLSSFGNSGSGAGQFAFPRNVAVDNDPSSPNFHDVYVTDNGFRVQRFDQSGAFEATIGIGQLSRAGDPIVVGPGADLYVLDSNGSSDTLKIFTPAGALVGSSILPNASWSDLAVNSAGNVYVSFQSGSTSIEKYEPTEPTATLLDSLAGKTNTTAIVVDGEDNLLAAQLEDFQYRMITKYDPSGTIVKRFGYGQFQFNLTGLAIGETGALFGSRQSFNETEGDNVVRISQPALGPLACCLTTTPRNTSATLKGGVNPEGKDTTYHFDYITQADYVANGNSFEGPNPAIPTPESASVGSDFDLYNVEAQVGCAKVEVPAQPSCLKPSTEYRYRLLASNIDGKSQAEGTFTTLPPLEIEEVFATDVGTDAGRLHAVVNPLGIPATGYFEYVDDASYQADLAEGVGHDGFAQATKVPDIDAGKAQIPLGEGEVDKEIVRELTSLEADTVYHYRFVINNPFATAESDAKVFTTFPLPTLPTRVCPNAEFRTAASAALPECRAYEMVSPVDKNGNDIKVMFASYGYPNRLDQSSDDGDRFTYSSSTAFGDAMSAPWSSQYLATREVGKGWLSHSLNPPRESVPLTDQYNIKLDVQYKLFDSELTNGWFVHDTEPALDECAPSGFINLYKRDNTTGEYEAMLPVEPKNVSSAESGYRLEVQGTSTDGTRTVFIANSKLTKDAANSITYQIYEHVADEGCGELRLVSYLPNGKAATQPASAGTGGQPGEHRSKSVIRAVSADASRVFFVVSAGGPLTDGPLYLRVNADQEQSPVSGGQCTDPSLGCTLTAATENAHFWTASTDGSKAIYSVGKNLYEFNTEKALAGEPASTLIAEGLNGSQGVAGANEDLSRLYFVTAEVLGGEGEAGKPNLYLREEGATKLVAILGKDGGDGRFGLVPGYSEPLANGARATADGRYLAFVTTASPTGYDNRDAVNGRPNAEVHLYDAVTDKVVCVSCNPSGSRPRGRVLKLTKNEVGAQVSAMMATAETQSFYPRALSADGNRIFFEGFEALLPRDTNGKADVYEWQRSSGEQACEEAGAELYVPSAEGCLSLISSGQSPVDTEFADASPDGRDVFIRTQSSLLPQDNGLIDIYDARIDGGFPQPPAPPAACEGEACQGPLNAPDDPTPASSAFEGAGNVSAEDKPASCRKPKVRRKGRCVAKKVRKAKAHKKQKRRAG